MAAKLGLWRRPRASIGLHVGRALHEKPCRNKQKALLIQARDGGLRPHQPFFRRATAERVGASNPAQRHERISYSTGTGKVAAVTSLANSPGVMILDGDRSGYNKCNQAKGCRIAAAEWVENKTSGSGLSWRSGHRAR